MAYKGFWNDGQTQYQVYTRPHARIFTTPQKEEAEEIFKMWVKDGPDEWNVDQVLIDKMVNGKRTTIKHHWFRR